MKFKWKLNFMKLFYCYCAFNNINNNNEIIHTSVDWRLFFLFQRQVFAIIKSQASFKVEFKLNIQRNIS